MPSHWAYEADERLKELGSFGSNPGALLAKTYVPADLPVGAPLVVVLHGCTQSAGSYNRGAGWTSAADEHDFALLFPEQQRHNNPNLCFNWFLPEDTARRGGEPQSIVQMIEAMCSLHELNRGQVFVTGLSAGGAMTAVMLATYPEIFAGGAAIAGLPFGTATSVPQAFEQMRGATGSAPDRLTRLVRSASEYEGAWPRLSVWHGSSDQTVEPGNSAALIDQWRGLHAVGSEPTITEQGSGHVRRAWCNSDGAEVLEEYVIAGMGHGTPISAGGSESGEATGPYMLDVGISSTRKIIAFWGLDAGDAVARAPAPQRETPATVTTPVFQWSAPAQRVAPTQPRAVQDVIEDALRKAGLMR